MGGERQEGGEGGGGDFWTLHSLEQSSKGMGERDLAGHRLKHCGSK